MIEEIKSKLDPEFEAVLFSAAQSNLLDADNPLRLNNYCYAMRELTRLVLHRLAPKDKLLNCVWYTNETQIADGVTRKQRAIYAVQGGLADSYVTGTLGLNVGKIHVDLVSAISKLSKFTHIQPEVFNFPNDKVESLVEDTTEAVFNFLDLIEACRGKVVDRLWEHIDDAVIGVALAEAIDSIDILATHHLIDEVYTDKVEIYDINDVSIHFRAVGDVACELQWGSNSDQKKGDGAIMGQSFPFQCELWSPISEPERVTTSSKRLVVDTSRWYE